MLFENAHIFFSLSSFHMDVFPFLQLLPVLLLLLLGFLPLRAMLSREQLLSLTKSLMEVLLPVASLSLTMLSYPLLTTLFLLHSRAVFPMAGGSSPLNTLVTSLAWPLR